MLAREGDRDPRPANGGARQGAAAVDLEGVFARILLVELEQRVAALRPREDLLDLVDRHLLRAHRAELAREHVAQVDPVLE